MSQWLLFLSASFLTCLVSLLQIYLSPLLHISHSCAVICHHYIFQLVGAFLSTPWAAGVDSVTWKLPLWPFFNTLNPFARTTKLFVTLNQYLSPLWIYLLLLFPSTWQVFWSWLQRLLQSAPLHENFSLSKFHPCLSICQRYHLIITRKSYFSPLHWNCSRTSRLTKLNTSIDLSWLKVDLWTTGFCWSWLML